MRVVKIFVNDVPDLAQVSEINMVKCNFLPIRMFAKKGSDDLDKGKPVVTPGRKASGLACKVAGLPKEPLRERSILSVQ